MPSYTLQNDYEAYLCRLSKKLSAQSGKKVSKIAALKMIIDVAIEEERLFSVEREQPVDFFRRNSLNPTLSINTKDKEEESPQHIITKIKASAKT